MGVLKIHNRKQFDTPRSRVYIPRYMLNKNLQDCFCYPAGHNILEEDCATNLFSNLTSSTDPRSTAHASVLAAGCLVVLDNQGFHVFSEDGRFIATIMNGLGYKYRGLALHCQHCQEKESTNSSNAGLYLLTVDTSDKHVAFLCVINLEKTLQKALHGMSDADLEKIAIEPTRQRSGRAHMDQTIKCRFVASNTANKGFQSHIFMGQNNSKDEMVYVSGMMSKQMYSINLQTKESKFLTLYQSRDLVDVTFLDRKEEATFVEKSTSVSEIKTQLPLLQPTGLEVDTNGNLLIADRYKNEVCVFAPTGKFVNEIVYGKVVGKDKMSRGTHLKYLGTEGKDVLCEPVGISLNRELPHLYICR